MERRDWLALAGFLIVTQMAGIVGSIFTSSAIPQWYSALEKPVLNPPSWVFGPVWSILYLLMAVAAFLIYRADAPGHHKRSAMVIYFVQLVLNAAWSIIFFGLRNPAIALVEIVVLWIAIVLSIFTFKRVSRAAAWMLVPYLVWVSFASYLNYSILILN